MKKKIIKCIQQLSGRYSPTSVFFDWVQCMALAISNTCHIVHGKTWQQREELYKATMSKYDKEERSKFAEMYGMLVMALEEGLGDTLGEIYMGSIGGDAGKGQFFTPYSLSLACASLTLPKENADCKITVNEPTCGSGGMIIAAAQILEGRGENYQRKLDVVCQDLDWTAVYMCYVQLSLFGIRAAVAQGNTLLEPYIDSYPAERVFYTPAKMGLLL